MKSLKRLERSRDLCMEYLSRSKTKSISQDSILLWDSLSEFYFQYNLGHSSRSVFTEPRNSARLAAKRIDQPKMMRLSSRSFELQEESLSSRPMFHKRCSRSNARTLYSESLETLTLQIELPEVLQEEKLLYSDRMDQL